MIGDERTPSCSQQSLREQEECAGTAPVATTWILVEQPGPWGRQALSDAHLPADLARQLHSLDALPHIKVLLTRHPSRTARSSGSPAVAAGFTGAHRRIWVSHAQAGGPHLLMSAVVDTADIMRLPLDREPDRLLDHGFRVADDRMVFICTHSGRDACCAVKGRALVNSLTGLGDSVWECSHMGGHRFAPTALLAPGNLVLGRCSDADVLRWIDSSRVDAHLLRGPAHLPAEQQAALVFLLRQEPLLQPSDLAVLPSTPASDHTVIQTTDGRSWQVDVARTTLPATRPESCGAEPSLIDHYVPTRIAPL